MNKESWFLLRHLKSILGNEFKVMVCWLLHGHVFRKCAIKKYFKSTASPKIQFGGGKRKLDGWMTTDIFGPIPVNITKNLPFKDNQLGLIYSSHLVEHIYKKDFKHFLREGHRILKPNGKNIIATPCIEKISKLWYYVNEKDEYKISTLKAHYGNRVEEDYFCASQHINIQMRSFGHRYIYDAELIRHLGLESGYQEIQVVDNFDVPDPILKEYLVTCKPKRWDIETMTVILTKGS